MRLARFKSEAQRLAGTKQVLLADHLIRRLRAKLLSQRGVYGLHNLGGIARWQG